MVISQEDKKRKGQGVLTHLLPLMHQQRPSAQSQRSATDSPRSSIGATAVAALLLTLIAIATFIPTATVVLTLLLRRRPATLAGHFVDVDVALLALVPAGDPGVRELLLLLRRLLLVAVRLLLLLLLLFLPMLVGERVEKLFHETGHFQLRLVRGDWGVRESGRCWCLVWR